MTTKEKLVTIGNVIGLVGGFGASMIIGGAAAPIIAGGSLIAKGVMLFGVCGMGGAVADKVGAWYQDQFDNLGDVVENVKELIMNKKGSKETEA